MPTPAESECANESGGQRFTPFLHTGGDVVRPVTAVQKSTGVRSFHDVVPSPRRDSSGDDTGHPAPGTPQPHRLGVLTRQVVDGVPA